MHRFSPMLPLCFLTLSLGAYACTARNPGNVTGTGGSGGVGGSGGASTSASSSNTASGTGGTIIIDPGDGGIIISDAQTEETPITPDAACAAVTTQAEVTVLPVDIIWMVDNSSSMAPAIQQIQNGLNSFATLIGGSGLDYQVIMLSLRGASPIMVSGSTRYPVCIPPPLSGDISCGDGTRFFQSSIDIRSTQPLEQFLGTLGQTTGYKAGDDRGGPPWAQHLRASATKTIVVVTDDNARLSATDFETFAGGKNPFNSLTLPPGILAPMWNGLFDKYIFSGIYGWGNASDPSVLCTFPDQTHPASSGPTYSTLVQKTSGVRAKICDGASAWQPFFNAVAQAVIETAKLSCELTIPPPSMGTLDPTKVNVVIGDGNQPVPGVTNAAACAGGEGWYYDDPVQPKKVILCPTSCDQAQLSIGPGKPGHIDVLFGCQTILK